MTRQLLGNERIIGYDKGNSVQPDGVKITLLEVAPGRSGFAATCSLRKVSQEEVKFIVQSRLAGKRVPIDEVREQALFYGLNVEEIQHLIDDIAKNTNNS